MQVWNEQREAQLAELWLQTPQLSSRQIANNLGDTTRNAVIGKARRLGLPPKKSGNGLCIDSNPRPRRPRKERVAKPVRGPTMKRLKPLPVRIAVSTEPQGPGISFDMLKSPHCRYAVNDEHPFLFCGEVKKEGSSYCEFHANLCREKRQ